MQGAHHGHPLPKNHYTIMDIINLHHLTKRYGNKTIFENASLSIPTGAFAVIRGESGAGKSTLINIIAGLEPIASGEIIVNSQDLAKLSSQQRTHFYRHEIGIIFQSSYLQPELTLLENITLPGIFANLAASERNSRAHQLADMLGISDVLPHLPTETSGGQAERACIARALLLGPKIILADEPTSNLDPINARTVLEILNSLRINSRLTVIVASHNEDAVAFATQIITVANGNIYDQHTNATPSQTIQTPVVSSPINQGDINDSHRNF